MFNSKYKTGSIWKVDYEKTAKEAVNWANKNNILPSYLDEEKVLLLLIDCQNCFCVPGGELFVGGKSGKAAVTDNFRLCEFVYNNIGRITDIFATLDSHGTVQIFHSIFWIDSNGNHPKPMTLIRLEDIGKKWRVNPNIIFNNINIENYVKYYVKKIEEDSKYVLTIWPYHAMIGGIGNSLVSSVEEFCFFHSIARCSQTKFEIKGNYPLTENYSVIKSEVTEDENGNTVGVVSNRLIDTLKNYDKIIIAGQAKSHCVLYTVMDLVKEIKNDKLYILEDCTSPIVTKEIDFTEITNKIFKSFSDSGVNFIRSGYII